MSNCEGKCSICHIEHSSENAREPAFPSKVLDEMGRNNFSLNNDEIEKWVSEVNRRFKFCLYNASSDIEIDEGVLDIKESPSQLLKKIIRDSRKKSKKLYFLLVDEIIKTERLSSDSKQSLAQILVDLKNNYASRKDQEDLQAEHLISYYGRKREFSIIHNHLRASEKYQNFKSIFVIGKNKDWPISILTRLELELVHERTDGDVIREVVKPENTHFFKVELDDSNLNILDNPADLCSPLWSETYIGMTKEKGFSVSKISDQERCKNFILERVDNENGPFLFIGCYIVNGVLINGKSIKVLEDLLAEWKDMLVEIEENNKHEYVYMVLFVKLIDCCVERDFNGILKPLNKLYSKKSNLIDRYLQKKIGYNGNVACYFPLGKEVISDQTVRRWLELLRNHSFIDVDEAELKEVISKKLSPNKVKKISYLDFFETLYKDVNDLIKKGK